MEERDMVDIDKEVEEGRLFAILSYISFLCFAPLFLKKENRFAFFHARQGLVIFIGEILAAVLSVVPFFGAIVQFLAILVFSIASVTGIIQVLMGQYWKMPYVYPIAEKINI
jgi:fumarate reductase subunit D